jgi:hypothetical protein
LNVSLSSKKELTDEGNAEKKTVSNFQDKLNPSVEAVLVPMRDLALAALRQL